MTVLRRQTWRGWLAWVVGLALAAAAGFLAGSQATRPPQAPVAAGKVITAEVVPGSVTVEQTYGINVDWPAAPVGVNGIDGTLTSLEVKANGSVIRAGDAVYSVDLMPVLALKGDVPAFREMETGTRGADVRQLEAFLIDSGWMSGSPDASFDSATATGVNRWWKKLGLAQDGRVPWGRVVFIPTLPTPLAGAPDVRIGARLSVGQEVLVGATAGPQFSFRVLPEAVARTTKNMTVTIDANGDLWQAQVDRLGVAGDDPDSMIATLRPTSDATSICGADCASIVPLGGKSVLPGRLILVPETSGLQVPSAAIRTGASGDACVVSDVGTPLAVTVLATSDDGRSIVEGVTSGQRILIAGKDMACS